MNWRTLLNLMNGEMASGFVVKSLTRLVFAAVLGGAIGLERELQHHPAGLRTNMFICFGAAWFTLLSGGLAGVASDAVRIAAQIIPGIGFIGAGSILHMRGLTTGLTSAATLFLVASIGMAAGGGLYLTAVFGTVMVLVALFALGHREETFNLRVLMSGYEVGGKALDGISNEVNRILEPHHRMMENVRTANTGPRIRFQFEVAGCNRDQQQFPARLRASTALESATPLGRVEQE